MDKLFEGLEDNSKLTVKEMRSRFLAYDAEKQKKEDELRNQMTEMSEMLKILKAESSGRKTAPEESYSQVNHDYPKNTSPMPHTIHSGNVPHFDGTHFSFWK